MRIGIDVGGTHTDAVLINGEDILATTKALTTQDVVSGILTALNTLLTDSGVAQRSISAIMIGTTQFTNAVVERRELSHVAAVRIGLPSGNGLPPMLDWPDDIADAVGRHIYMLRGGYLYDGWPIAKLDEHQVDAMVADLLKKGLKNIALTSAFSPMNNLPEKQVADKIRAAIPDANITLSSSIGRLGILERENAAILNTALLPFAKKVVNAFTDALKQRGLTCPMFISQNDGTLMNASFVKQFPALTFASGPTNSLRGASKLTGITDGIVVDIGGTTSDIGILHDGFPRESNMVIEVGGVRTNFRMPDINAVGMGGGSVVSADGHNIGPFSVGHKLLEQGLVFGGDVFTLTDLVVAAGEVDIGNKALVANIPPDVIKQGMQTMLKMMEQNIEMMKPNSKPVPIIFVGGGAVLFNQSLKSATQTIRPQHAGVANAIGASIAQIGGEAERMLSYRAMSREAAVAQVTEEAKIQALQAGANADSLRIADIEETAVPYMDDGSMRVRVKVIGDVAAIVAPQSN